MAPCHWEQQRWLRRQHISPGLGAGGSCLEGSPPAPAPSVAVLQAERRRGINASSHPRLWRAFYWRQWQQDQSGVLRLFPWSLEEFNGIKSTL